MTNTTSFSVERVAFDKAAVRRWQAQAPRHRNWPVVYTIDGSKKLYVGESLSAAGRLHQHLESGTKQGLQTVRVILDDKFNKSVCLDLESYLIRLFAGDGRYEVLNGNAGITDRNYYDRDSYQAVFHEIFSKLRDDGLFDKGVKEIENSDLFKLSPFKALNDDQAVAVMDIMEGLLEDFRSGNSSTAVVQGDPGTGKTIVGIFLMKLLLDIQSADLHDAFYSDSLFAEFFLPEYAELLTARTIGLVIPQQSLRDSIKKVFRKTPRLRPDMVLSPFDVGKSTTLFDLLIVDETHRLNQRANQASGVKNREFSEINIAIFGTDDPNKTQLDWIKAKSAHQIFLLDADQSVRPADLPRPAIDHLVATSTTYPLRSQMRIAAGGDYISHIRGLLDGTAKQPLQLSNYEFNLFDDLSAMRDAINDREATYGLSRMVAGFAWPWVSRKDPQSYDIVLDGCHLQWNRADKDWINSRTSLDEVGSIHTVQGYDLNYAGVIIGPDLQFNTATGKPFINRTSYYDRKGKENNPTLGITYTDDDLLTFILNIYSVLLTRGMRGTFVYAVDPSLREHLRTLIPSAPLR